MMEVKKNIFMLIKTRFFTMKKKPSENPEGMMKGKKLTETIKSRQVTTTNVYLIS